MTIEIEHPADLLSIGAHCAMEGCHQLDFLPFHCSGCDRTYCLDHRQPESHTCSNPPSSVDVFVCPVCARAVRLENDEDPNSAFERHASTNCDPRNYARVNKKPRCPAQSCREKLTSINSYTCKDCGVTVCLKHRLGSDHGCPGRRVASASGYNNRQGFGSGLRASLNAFFASGRDVSVGESSSKELDGRRGGIWKPQPQRGRASNGSSMPAATSHQSQLESYRRSHQSEKSSEKHTAHPSHAGVQPEICPVCRMKFADVQSLIDHAAAMHQEGWSSGSDLAARPGESSDGAERCVRCGTRFREASDLVTHVQNGECDERQRSGNGESAAGRKLANDVCIVS